MPIYLPIIWNGLDGYRIVNPLNWKPPQTQSSKMHFPKTSIEIISDMQTKILQMTDFSLVLRFRTILHQSWVPGSIWRVPCLQSCTQPLQKKKGQSFNCFNSKGYLIWGHESIYHTEWNICRHAESDRLGQRSGFGEEVQVVQCKNKLHRLIHLNCHL